MPERKPPTAALMVGAAITELSNGPDGIELILAAHGPSVDAAALLMRCMSKVASVLIAAPDLAVPTLVTMSPHRDTSAELSIYLPVVQTIGEASAAVMGWTLQLDAEPENLRENPHVGNPDQIDVWGFARLPFGGRAFVLCPYVAPNPLPEIECADCQGTGKQRDGSPCADCLGKGRIGAPAAGE